MHTRGEPFVWDMIGPVEARSFAFIGDVRMFFVFGFDEGDVDLLLARKNAGIKRRDIASREIPRDRGADTPSAPLERRVIARVTCDSARHLACFPLLLLLPQLTLSLRQTMYHKLYHNSQTINRKLSHIKRLSR